MSKDIGDDVFTQSTSPPIEEQGIINHNDGYEWLEYPIGSDVHFYRTQKGQDWTKWEN